MIERLHSRPTGHFQSSRNGLNLRKKLFLKGKAVKQGCIIMHHQSYLAIHSHPSLASHFVEIRGK